MHQYRRNIRASIVHKLFCRTLFLLFTAKTLNTQSTMVLTGLPDVCINCSNNDNLLLTWCFNTLSIFCRGSTKVKAQKNTFVISILHTQALGYFKQH